MTSIRTDDEDRQERAPEPPPGCGSTVIVCGPCLLPQLPPSARRIHAAAIGAHAEHPRRRAGRSTAVAVFQLAWGAVALVSWNRAVALIGVAGLVRSSRMALAKWKGLRFVEGLEEAEPVQFADGLCAALAALAALDAGGVLLGRDSRSVSTAASRCSSAERSPSWPSPPCPGWSRPGKHVHAGVQTKSAVVRQREGQGRDRHCAVPPKPTTRASRSTRRYPGCHRGAQARAENVVAETVVRLPHEARPPPRPPASSRPQRCHRFRALHQLRLRRRRQILDPDRPSRLILLNGKKTLQSAMSVLKPGSTPTPVPDVGGTSSPSGRVHENLLLHQRQGHPHRRRAHRRQQASVARRSVKLQASSDDPRLDRAPGSQKLRRPRRHRRRSGEARR